MTDKKDALKKIVGSDNVIDDAEVLDSYSKDKSFVPPRKPQFVVKPKNVDEVQELVKWANCTSTPLVPISSSPPHFHGDTIPTLGGAVIVDLVKMNRIIRINRRNRMVIVEPGVTFSQLQPELAKEGMRLPMPLHPRNLKSVMGSLLEREPTIIPRCQWVLNDPLRCIHIVWGNGDTLMTGEAGWHGSLEEQWAENLAQVMPMGPAQVDYYRLVQGAQGSMGIVTWAAARCELLPQFQKLLFVHSSRIDNLLAFTYKLLRFRYGDEILFLNSSYLASILCSGDDEAIALKAKLPQWVLIICLAGNEILPRESVEIQENAIKGLAQQFGVYPVLAIPGIDDGQVMGILSRPSQEPYWKLRNNGGCQDIFFLTTLNRTPELVSVVHSVAEALNYPTAEIGMYIQPLQQGVACHCEFSLPFNPSDQRKASDVQDFFVKCSEALIKQGAYFSRPYGIWADMVYNRDAQTTIALKKIKGIFDPNNIMNPGKLCF